MPSLCLATACGASGSRAEEPGPRPVAPAAGSEEQPSPAAAAIGPDAPLPPEDTVRFRVPVGEAPTRGAERPLVTIVAFSDFQCPFCANAAETLDRLVRRYPKEVRVAFRHLPLINMHPDALPAAEAAVEAQAQGGDEKFWQMHELLFANQQALSDANLIQYAETMGLDVEAFREALYGGVHRRRIRDDMELAVGLGVRGTPAHFVNGRKLVGAKPLEEFDAMVREEIALARQLMAEGIPRDELYSHLMEQARTAPPQAGSSAARPPRLVPDPDAVYAVPVGDAPSKGPDDALLTLVVFGDVQSRECKRLLAVLERLRQEHDGELRLVWKSRPLPSHQQAMPAAVATLEAREQGGDELFWRLQERLMERQAQLSRETIVAEAREVGVEVAALRLALEQGEHRDVIDAHVELAGRLGARSAPVLFANGRRLRGPATEEAVRALAREALAAARAEVAGGVPRAELYERIVERGATEPQYVERAAPAGREARRLDTSRGPK